MPGDRRYETRQEGPFWRVNPLPAGASGQGPGGAQTAAWAGAEPANGSARGVPAQPPADPLQVAQAYSREHFGRDYEPIPNLPSSLRKQHPIGLAYELAASRHPEYEKRVFEAYKRQRPELVGRASGYDELRMRAYNELLRETMQQFDALPTRMSYHRNGEGNYPNSKAMADDVRHNNHLYVYQGGEPHEFLHVVDPRTGLSANDMFRAVHDYFGHAVHGTTFGPHGEERAWAAHSALFSPLAHAALSSETRGQNSFVNYSPVNAVLKARVAKLSDAIAHAQQMGDRDEATKLMALRQELMGAFQYAKQAAVLLPPEMLRGDYKGGVPDYLRDLIQPKPEHATSADLVHYSRHPSLTRTDPRFYGTGIAGADVARAKGQAPDRTYFYVGEPRQREGGLGVHKYKTRVDNLYDLAQDPLHLHELARESNRAPHTAQVNPGVIDHEAAANDLERMVHERGFNGVLNPNRNVAAVFNPVEVQKYASGGIVSAVDKALPTLKRKKGSYDEYMAELRSKPGIKPAELEYRDVGPAHREWLKQNLPSMTADEFANQLAGRQRAPFPRVHELRPGDEHPAAPGEPHEGFESFTLPGGSNYREMLFTHTPQPTPDNLGQKPFLIPRHFGSIPNVLAHARLKDRIGPNGEKVLHVEEVQSDWHQQGRKHGYRTPLDAQMLKQAVQRRQDTDRALTAARMAVGEEGISREEKSMRNNRVAELIGEHMKANSDYDKLLDSIAGRVPEAPFKKDWHEMVLKHLVAHAAKNGYDMLALTPGEEQAKRFNIGKHIDSLRWDFVPGKDENGFLIVGDKNGREHAQAVAPKDLGDHVGKELAERILSSHNERLEKRKEAHAAYKQALQNDAPEEEQQRLYSALMQLPPSTKLSGLDLHVGGEGMKTFYDKMLPAFLNKLGKPFGAKVAPLQVREPRPEPTTSDAIDSLLRDGYSSTDINNRAELYRQRRQQMLLDHAANPFEEHTLHGFPITPELREHVEQQGLPLFAKGGSAGSTMRALAHWS